MKLDSKQDPNFLYQDCVFRADQYTKVAVLADPSKRWHMVLGCKIRGPLGLLFVLLGGGLNRAFANLTADHQNLLLEIHVGVRYMYM